MASGPEARITAQCRRWLDKQDLHCIKIHQGAYQAGQVDLLICVRGHMVWIEMKVPGRDATPKQAAAMRTWERAGATTATCHSLEEVKAVIEPLLGSG